MHAKVRVKVFALSFRGGNAECCQDRSRRLSIRASTSPPKPWEEEFRQKNTTKILRLLVSCLSASASTMIWWLVVLPLVLWTSCIIRQLLPKRRTEPPTVFHWFPFLGSAVSYGTNPQRFFSRCRDKARMATPPRAGSELQTPAHVG